MSGSRFCSGATAVEPSPWFLSKRRRSGDAARRSAPQPQPALTGEHIRFKGPASFVTSNRSIFFQTAVNRRPIPPTEACRTVPQRRPGSSQLQKFPWERPRKGRGSPLDSRGGKLPTRARPGSLVPWDRTKARSVVPACRIGAGETSSLKAYIPVVMSNTRMRSFPRKG